jgi:hypothetical protein
VNTYNNVLSFNPNAGGFVSAVVPVGVYNATSFSSALQTAMAAVAGGATYTVTVSTQTGKITIVQNAGTYVISRANSTIAPIIGLNQSLGNSSASITFTGDYVVNLSGTNLIIVKSNELTKYGTKSISSQTASLSSIVARIPVNVGWGGTIVFKPYNKVYQYIGKKANQIDFALYDQYDNPLDLNGADWFLNLKFHTSQLSNPDLNHYVRSSRNDDLAAATFSSKN